MPGLHSLDRIIGDAWPILATDDALRAFESVPFEERIAARSTYEALRCGAAREPKAPAILFLPNASPEDDPGACPTRLLRPRDPGGANALHSLGFSRATS